MKNIVTLSIVCYFVFLTSEVELADVDRGIFANRVVGRSLMDDLEPHLKIHKSLLRDAINITFKLSLKHIIKLDEHDQIIKLDLRVSMDWQDAFFQWTPASHDGITEVVIPSETTWQPDVVLYNCVQEDYKTQIEYPNIIVTYDGSVKYSYPIATEALCLVDVTYFPFDQQVCRLEFGSWAYTIDNINLLLKDDSSETSEYLKNSAWDLRSFKSSRELVKYACCESDFSLLYFDITIRRRWALYGAYLILPNFIMNVLCIVQFLLPCDSNERVGLGITLYLSLLVYLILIESILPSTEDFPYFVIYIFTTLIEVSIAEVLTILVLYLHNKGIHDNQAEMGSWTRQFLQSAATVVCMRESVMASVMKERVKSHDAQAQNTNVDLASNMPGGQQRGNVNVNAAPDEDAIMDSSEKPDAPDEAASPSQSLSPSQSRGRLGSAVSVKSASSVLSPGQSQGRLDSTESVKVGFSGTPITPGEARARLNSTVSVKASSSGPALGPGQSQGRLASKESVKASPALSVHRPSHRASVSFQPAQEFDDGSKISPFLTSAQAMPRASILSTAAPSYRRPSILSNVALGDMDRHVTTIKKSELENNQGFLLNSILKICEKYEDRVMNEHKAKIVRQEWQQLAMICDRLMFYTFLFFNVVLWVVLIVLLLVYRYDLTDYPK